MQGRSEGLCDTKEEVRGNGAVRELGKMKTSASLLKGFDCLDHSKL